MILYNGQPIGGSAQVTFAAGGGSNIAPTTMLQWTMEFPDDLETVSKKENGKYTYIPMYTSGKYAGQPQGIRRELFNRTPDVGEVFWGIAKTTDDGVVAFTAVSQGLNIEDDVLFTMEEVLVLHSPPDQTYNPQSTNPQSGKAINKALTDVVSVAETYADGILEQAESYADGEITKAKREAIQAAYQETVLRFTDAMNYTDGKIASLGGAVTIPSYWQESVDAAISKVKEKQDASGKDTVNFVWFSDFHFDGATKSHVGNVGSLCAYVMDACDIPLTLMNGDTLTAGVLPTEEKLLTALESAMKLYAPIGTDRLMLLRGNHDDVYGSYTDGDNTTSYVNKVAPQKVWNKLHRPQAKDFRRVFGGDGTYFYLDNIPQKVRFVCLNSHFYDGDGITNGTAKTMTFAFGAEQLDWLENKALSVEEGWGVVVSLHTPPIADYASYFNGTDYADFRSIITESTADIIAIFCGHAHKDRIITNDLPCPVCTVTCAINTPYDGTASERVAGTDKETAIDIVSIDRKAGKIYMTRLGAGSDREVTYREPDEPVPEYTNLADQSSADWLKNKRYSASQAVFVTQEGVDTTNYIPVTQTTKLHIKGFDIESSLAAGSNYGRILFYDANKTYFEMKQPNTDLTPNGWITTATYDETVRIVDLAAIMAYYNNMQNGAVSYVRLSGILTAEKAIVTDNQEIV